jgi:hypothetical protein
MTFNQPPPMPARQLNLEDESHLHLLSVFHFVMGGLYTLGIGFIALHFFIMWMVMKMPPEIMNIMILNTAVGYQFFTAEAQRSQRNAEPCMWEDRNFGKTMELLGSPNG